MKIRFSLALALLSTVNVLACSEGVDGVDPAPSNEPRSAAPGEQTAPAAPQGRGNHIAPSTRLSTSPSLSGMRVLAGEAVSTNKTSYAYGEPIQITFTNMPGTVKDWVDIAPASDTTNLAYSWYAYTNSIHPTSGVVSTAAGDFLPPGTYVARMFPNDTYTLLAQSTTFTVGAKPAETATVTVDKTTYGGFEAIRATFSGATPNANVTVSIHQPYGSTGTEFALASVQADGTGAGTVSLRDIVAGDFQVRVLEGTSWKGTSATFRMNPAIRTNKTTYTVGENVMVDFNAMQALTVNDSVALAVAGSANTAKVGTPVLVDWHWAGYRYLDTTGLTPGTYVARVFFDFSTTSQAESATFTLTAP